MEHDEADVVHATGEEGEEEAGEVAEGQEHHEALGHADHEHRAGAKAAAGAEVDHHRPVLILGPQPSPRRTNRQLPPSCRPPVRFCVSL